MANSSSITLKFGGYIASVPTLASLRNYQTADLDENDTILVAGASAAGDNNGGAFIWLPNNSDADNGTTIIAPTNQTTGRWKLSIGRGNTGLTGPQGPVGDVTPAATAAKLAAEAARDAAATSANNSANSATAAATSAASVNTTALNAATAGTAADRAATAADRADVAAKAADVTAKAAQVASNKTATDTARDQAVAAAAAVDTTAIANAKAATAADRIAVQADKVASDTNAATSQTARDAAVAAANATGFTKFYSSKSAANAAFASATNLSVIEVFPDESRDGRVARYRKDTSVSTTQWQFVRYMPQVSEFWVHSGLGSDTNDGRSGHTPLKSLAALATVLGFPGFQNTGPNQYARIHLMDGSHWYGEKLANLPPFAEIVGGGQGNKPIIDGAIDIETLATGPWTYNATYDCWQRPIAMRDAVGSGAGTYPAANMWHVALWADTIASRVTDAGLPRILNGDPLPDAAYDVSKPQTTTIAQTSINGLLAILRDSPIGGFNIYEIGGSSGYEPRNAASTSRNFMLSIRNPNFPDPTVAGGPVYRINEFGGLGVAGQANRFNGIVFARNGGKDLFSGNLPAIDSSNNQVLGSVGTSEMRECEFYGSVHGMVAFGVNFIGCHFAQTYVRASTTHGGGAFHNFRPTQSDVSNRVDTGEGYRIENCTANGAGIFAYSHGLGTSVPEHDQCKIIGARAHDIGAFMGGGANRKGGYARDCIVTSLDIISGGDKDWTAEKCAFFGRPGGLLSVDLSAPGVTATFKDSIVAADFLKLPYATNGSIPAGTFPKLFLKNSLMLGAIANPGNNGQTQHDIILRNSYLGKFVGTGSTPDVFTSGSIDTDSVSIIETNAESIEALRARFPGIAAGCETGVRRQVWTKTLTASDMDFNGTGYAAFTASYAGGGTGSSTAVTTSYNYGYTFRGIRIVDAYGPGLHYDGRLVSNTNTSQIVISPVPTAAFTNKTVVPALLAPVMRDGVTARISLDGTKLTVPNGARFTPGMSITVGRVRASAKTFGLRKVASVTGNVITLDTPCVWNTVPNATYYPSGDPAAPLPSVAINWGWSFQPPAGNGYSYPSYSVAKAEGGVIAGVESPYALIADHERGFWTTFDQAAIGDTLTLTADIDIPELRMQLATPWWGTKQILPTPDCAVGYRRLGPSA